MPTERPTARDSLYPLSPVDKMLATDERNRRPKTMIPDVILALYLGRMSNHARRLRARGLDKIAQVWEELHQEILEHLGSVDGFTMRVAVGMLRLRDDSEKGRESSIGATTEHD